MYFTAEDHARFKVYALPIPSTSSASASTGYPLLPKQFHNPVPLIHKGAASGVQLLPGGRLLFSRSSFASPDDVYVLQDLSSFESDIVLGSSQALKPKIKQVTRFNAEALESKGLDEGEEFWFKGALDRDVQGWLFKPKGWDEKDTKKWPLAMVIHGGKIPGAL
jgi:dipeptidyl aminopeptidase/acylaminoacyl peptidase